jgi:hypothetical protein
MYRPNEHWARNISGYYSWLDSPLWAIASPLLKFRNHTPTHHILWDSSGRVIGPLQRPLPDNTQQSQRADIHVSGGFEPAIPSKRAAQTHTLDRKATVSDDSKTFQLILQRLKFTSINYDSTIYASQKHRQSPLYGQTLTVATQITLCEQNHNLRVGVMYSYHDAIQV